MLFVATSINYMDRQVIAILKPTLEHSMGMTEVGYGDIVDAFQMAYAIGLLAAGRLIGKMGTRIGYLFVMAVWSLSAMGHALASTVFQFGMARFFLGLGESGNFPAAIKTVAEWFPQNETLTRYRDLQLRYKYWSDAGSGYRAVGNAALGLARSLSRDWAVQCALDSVVVSLFPRALQPPHTYRG
jgi:MFS family permease